ncbi:MULTISPECIES: sensor histidine kinase [unclassified Polaromonas]|uniref:sensor histidine kinase n=1 Tax=unclassified Polaromonas TaxID=2638319 RepID=UPI000F0839B0|nr:MULTISPECIES: sensor histidine kinase [unclassified Polaromonas]AYQ30348.1 sensor histidine kinase [Polaromonas sp. SP1]QGJ20746.1 HAMP domain-containing protein [Polaromonas sp. Pch-P]
MKSGLQRRLLMLLLVPLGIFALVSIYFDYQTAGNVALQKDQQLARLIPLLADSVVAPGITAGREPLLLLAPAVEDFLKGRTGSVGFRLSDAQGEFLAGEAWIPELLPATHDIEFHSLEHQGVIYRIAAQRTRTSAGELIVQLADGSDPRQQWVRSVLFKVLLPNLILVVVAGFAVNWAVMRALKPLIELKDAVERRSPRDLSAIDPLTTPAEVQPLVTALNRLFGLVNDQAEGQRRFVADAAHQLRTPLAGLQAQVEAWAQAARVGQAAGSDGAVTLPAEKIIKLRNATRRTSQLANQLLALSRADASAAAAQPMQRVDLKDLCESILPLHLDAATRKGIDLGLDAQPAQASGYEWLLRELLGNLVDNAVKYTPPGGTVTIRCGPGAGPQPDPDHPRWGVFLEVEDDGPGIAPEERGKALERFYRVLGTVGEGNGLGLAIANEIARVHRSQLELDDASADASGPRGLRVRLSL